MEKNWLEQNWWMLLVRGIFAVLFGIMAMVWPSITAIAFAVVWGFWALLDGVVSIASAFRRGSSGKVWLVVFGVISVIAGLVAIIHPGDVAVILTWVLSSRASAPSQARAPSRAGCCWSRRRCPC